MAYRESLSTARLRWQLDDLYPDRSTASDGWIGDAAHQTRESDHNPWIVWQGVGVVTARDVTHDPVNGPDCHDLATLLIQDHRTKYVIWDRRIYDSRRVWLPYDGPNPHTAHLHLSVSSTQALFDDNADWDLGVDAMPGYGSWTQQERDRMLEDIREWAVANVPVRRQGAAVPERLTDALSRLEALQLTVAAHGLQLNMIVEALARLESRPAG